VIPPIRIPQLWAKPATRRARNERIPISRLFGGFLEKRFTGENRRRCPSRSPGRTWPRLRRCRGGPESLGLIPSAGGFGQALFVVRGSFGSSASISLPGNVAGRGRTSPVPAKRSPERRCQRLHRGPNSAPAEAPPSRARGRSHCRGGPFPASPIRSRPGRAPARRKLTVPPVDDS